MPYDSSSDSYFVKAVEVFSNHKAILVGILAGVVIGVIAKPLVIYVKPLGVLYSSLLVMCILPLAFTSIITGMAAVLQNANAEKKLIKLGATIIVSALLVAVFSVGMTIAFKAQLQLKTEAQSALVIAQRVEIMESYSSPSSSSLSPSSSSSSGYQGQRSPGHQYEHKQSKQPSKLGIVLQQFIPDNIFTALYGGLSVKVIILALLIGVALGKIRSEYTKHFSDVIVALNALFHKIFDWLMVITPFGLMGVFAEVTSHFSPAMLYATLNITVLIHVISALLLMIYCGILCRKFKVSLWGLLKLFKQPLIIACATRQSLAAVPSSIAALATLPIDDKLMRFIMPFGIVLNRQGHVVLFAVVAMFSLIFFNIAITPEKIVTTIVLSGLLGVCAYGNPLAYIPMFVILTKTIGVPSVMGVAIIMVSHLLVDTIETVLALFTNYAVVAIVAKKEEANTGL